MCGCNYTVFIIKGQKNPILRKFKIDERNKVIIFKQFLQRRNKSVTFRSNQG